jgi:PAS domain S-box-containing protein
MKDGKLIQVFRNYPIRRKMMFIMLITSMGTLLIACGVLFAYQSIALRSSIYNDLLVLAQVIARQSIAAVSFLDKQATDETLNALKVKPNIISAQIFNKNSKKSLSSYGPETDFASKLYIDGYRVEGRYVYVCQPITLEGKQIGTLYLQADFQTIYRDLLMVYGRVLLLVMLGALVFITFVASLLQRVITKPILELGRTAEIIAENKDYSMRAEKTCEDEIGVLTDAFNQMLEQIYTQDIALKESRERFEVAMIGARDGLWDWNLITRQIYFSPQWKSMLGYAEHELSNEYSQWEQLLHPDEREVVLQHLNDYLQEKIQVYEIEYRLQQKDGGYRWVLSRGAVLRDNTGRSYRMAGSQTDITERKQSEKELENLNQQLQKMSRQAGMAEVATGVLHNVGNVLNSVNVSAALIADNLRQYKLNNLSKSVELLNGNLGDASRFLNSDAKGKLLPVYLLELTQHMSNKQQTVFNELDLLTRNIEHIKEIVAVQQSYAKVSGVVEAIDLIDIIEDALQINMGGFNRHHVQIVREFTKVPKVYADRHKVLQILINLLSNAKYALIAHECKTKCITVRLEQASDLYVSVYVIDSGMGIDNANINKIFNHGYTTRRDGHGFGLHSGANDAKEMGGSLRAHSDGIGKGATFTFTLPIVFMQRTKPMAVAV